MAIVDPIHFIVAKSRRGWSVNVDADQISEHAHVEEARSKAHRLTDLARLNGEAAAFVDLSHGHDLDDDG